MRHRQSFDHQALEGISGLGIKTGTLHCTRAVALEDQDHSEAAFRLLEHAVRRPSDDEGHGELCGGKAPYMRGQAHRTPSALRIALASGHIEDHLTPRRGLQIAGR